MAALTCPACGTLFSPENVDLRTGLARCLPCGTIHQVGASTALARPAVARPPSVTEESLGTTLTLHASWMQTQAWFLLLFCFVWDSFLITWYVGALLGVAGALASKEPATAAPIGMMLVFPLVHVAVGVFLTYYTAALFKNRTTLVVDRNLLTVTHGPLRWSGGAQIPAKDIDQLYVVERRGNKGAITYRLAALVNGTVTLLTTSHADVDQMRYLEQRIEAHLGIQDRRVTGEVL